MREKTRTETLKFLELLSTKNDILPDDVLNDIRGAIILLNREEITQKLIEMEEKNDNFYTHSNGLTFDSIMDLSKEKNLLCEQNFKFRIQINSKWSDVGGNVSTDNIIMRVTQDEVSFTNVYSFNAAFGTDFSNNTDQEKMSNIDQSKIKLVFQEWTNKIIEALTRQAESDLLIELNTFI